MRTLYGTEALRYMLVRPVCAVRGHRWPLGKCKRCGEIDPVAVAELEAIGRAMKPIAVALRKLGRSAAETGAAMRRAFDAMDRAEREVGK